MTCVPHLETALIAAKAAGIPEKHAYIVEMPKEFTGSANIPYKTVGQLIAEETIYQSLNLCGGERARVLSRQHTCVTPPGRVALL
jgi:hypothetical protein